MPILALALLAFLWGTFPGAASAAGATASGSLLLLLGATAAPGWRRLGRREAVALLLLGAAVVLSTAWSEVPRAGRSALALGPAFAILPWLGAHRFAPVLRSATRALALLLAAVAAGSLWVMMAEKTPGASWPLGHHNILAVFLLLLLPAPLALWSGGGRFDKGAAVATAGLGLAALIATRSLGGALALGFFVLLAVPRPLGNWPFRKWLPVLLVVFGLLVLGLLPRLQSFGGDLGLSREARWGYLEAGWQGFRAAPIFGHGPGSTPWLFARYFEPQVAVHPPDHIVADLHCLPLQVLFELGLAGFLAAALWLYVILRPLWRAPLPEDPFRAAWVRLGRAGLAAGLVFSATGFLLSVPALPFAFVLLAGFCHAALNEEAPAATKVSPTAMVPGVGAQRAAPATPAERPTPSAAKAGDIGSFGDAPTDGRSTLRPCTNLLCRWLAPLLSLAPRPYTNLFNRWLAPLLSLAWGAAPLDGRSTLRPYTNFFCRWLGPLLTLAAWWLLLPGMRAHWAWDRARIAPNVAAASEALQQAVRLDPDFPLYRARLGLLANNPAEVIRAARDGVAIGPLTLQAGLAAEAAGLPEAASLLAEACDLDPFSGLAPFRLAVGPAGGDLDLRVERAMRALVAEPRLVAAAAWRERPEILLRAQVRLDREGPPKGWSAALLPSMERLLSTGPGPAADLVLRLDRDPAEAVSLFVFRRSPWEIALQRVRVHPEALPRDMAPAVTEPGTRPDFAAKACRWHWLSATKEGFQAAGRRGEAPP